MGARNSREEDVGHDGFPILDQASALAQVGKT